MTQLALDVGNEAPRFKVMEIEKGQWLQPCFGAKCAACGGWLTKWDFTAEDAAVCARDALERTDRWQHRCRRSHRVS